MSDTLVAPNLRYLDALAGQLARWMGGRLPRAVELRLHDFAYPSGAGMSHETILFDASWHDADGPVTQGFVVRVKPVANQVFVDDLFDRQFRVQRLMFEKQWLPVAEPLWFEAERSVMARMGGTWADGDQQQLIGGSLGNSVAYMRARAAAMVVLPTPPLPATIRTRLCAQKVPTSMSGRA